MSGQFAIGIDLGTTNSVLAYAPADDPDAPLALLDIPQVVAPHTVEGRTALASFCYQAPQDEEALRLPWREAANFCIGEHARRQAAEEPTRTISAAKSWLSHGRVDRRAPILPWQAPSEVETISPVLAAQRYLEHLAAAWAQAMPDAPLAAQSVVLTVPASFDAVARELTREAAFAAGLPEDLVLLEEPQAAVYAHLAARGDRWRDDLALDDCLLVCDVGGGTTDLTLIQVQQADGELVLHRQAVGNHLLVGGDNMDLALAHLVAGQFAERGTQLDPWQSVSLWHSCRKAKESLLGESEAPTHTISVLGRGSKLIGGTVSVEVQREAVAALLLDGFFPECGADEQPLRARASGFQELGLPFEADTGITRHIAHFLAKQGSATTPTHVLFNGGVFKSPPLRNRLLEIVRGWNPDRPTRSLTSESDLDHAVALGAAHYARTKAAGGVRIRGGVARSYYVGMETAGLAIPGAPRPLRALCVVPMGMEEGTQVEVPAAPIGLVHGEPAEFRFFSSTARSGDGPGDLLDRWEEDELVETAPLVATLPAEANVTEPYVPVTFESRITELGVCELWCVATQGEGRWKLEFNVRHEE